MGRDDCVWLIIVVIAVALMLLILGLMVRDTYGDDMLWSAIYIASVIMISLFLNDGGLLVIGFILALFILIGGKNGRN